MSPDHYHSSAGPNNPGSWNRYAYVQGDPINANDPRGMEFMTPDSGRARPADPGSWNKYAYAGNDPVNRLDPRGRDWCTPDDLFCFGPSGPADLGDLIYGLDFDFSALAAEITAQLQSALATPQFELGVDLFPLFSQGLVTNWSFSGGSISDITVNWDAVFGYLAAAPVALPLPGISGGLTWDELLAALRANPLTLLLASILVQTGGPPNFPQHNCPDKNHFWDPAKSPGTNWQWTGNGPVGSSQGSWYNTITGESLHPDLNHPGPIGPHWDYTDPTGQIWRCNPDGTFSKKNGN